MKDVKRLILTPEKTLSQSPPLDLLLVPGGYGQDGAFVSAGGVTAGIDGALRVAALLRGDRVAQEIQLQIQYAPEPPFNSGTPATAPPEILEAAQSTSRAITEARLMTAKRIAAKLGVAA